MPTAAQPPITHTFFVGSGAPQVASWRVTEVRPVVGKPLTPAERLHLHIGQPGDAAHLEHIPPPAGFCVVWSLRGTTTNARYATAAEQARLRAIQAPLGRPEARCAALIPIRKSPEWWAMSQDQRRAVFEDRSRHTAIGLEYLPAISRRLIHCHDHGGEFDFLTWFECAPEHAPDFEHLVDRLRETKEWKYVNREVDIRLTR